MSEKIIDYIKREMCGGKKDLSKVLGVFPEHILCAVEEDYIGYSGLYFYLDEINENYKPDFVVISTHLCDRTESELMEYFSEQGISVRTSNEFDEKNKIAMIICMNDIDRSDVMFRINVPMDVYVHMGKRICAECYAKISKEYPQEAKEFKKIGFFNKEKCPVCGR